MRRSSQTVSGKRLKETRKRFNLNPISNTTQKRVLEVNKARAKRIRRKHQREGFLAKNPFEGF